MIAYLHWDPSPSIFPWNLPLLGRPILWYGVFFALGFFLAYLAFVSLLKLERKNNARKIADQISTYLLIGILLGARLFDIFFYERIGSFFKDPLFAVRLWEGGLSSHGAVIGLLAAVFIFQRRHRYFTTLHLLDLLAIVTGIAAACIRIGNFFNQEILGKPTDVPWAIVFGHPVDGSFPVPRHPVQLYEALVYLFLFALMWKLKNYKWADGRLCGLFLIGVFSLRVVIEFFKEEQSIWLQNSFFTMGQWLSVPFILLGLFLFFRKSQRGKTGNSL
ncbi:MAG: prolipoprotein diacylglyceryl transferase [Rhabdochlamydiaceae bacterium]|jgi:prolipoprotein diacylglyceryl transferase